MTYEQFRDFIASFLWRDGDAVLIANLPALIRMAQASMQRDVKTRDTLAHVQLLYENANTEIGLPTDFRSVDVLVGPEGDFDYLRPGEFARQRDAGKADQVYTIMGRSLYLASGRQGDLTASMVYYRTLPDLVLENGSWLLDLHLDLYVYAVLQHAGFFLKDDDRVPGWTAAYDKALGSVVNEDARLSTPANGPLRMTFGGR